MRAVKALVEWMQEANDSCDEDNDETMTRNECC